MLYTFEWDPAKAAANAKKHGVTFELAAGVFKDPMALTLFDEEQSDEDRWITLGLVDGQHYLVVVHTYRDEHNDTVTNKLLGAATLDRLRHRAYQVVLDGKSYRAPRPTNRAEKNGLETGEETGQ